MDNTKNALAELAERMSSPVELMPGTGDSLIGLNRNQLEAYKKAQRIVAELAKEFEPIDLSLVERGADGRKHVSDFVKATDRRRCEIMIKCREIAEEGGAK